MIRTNSMAKRPYLAAAHKVISLCLIVFTSLTALLSTQAHSHHSYSIYDRTKDVSLTGKLTRFDFIQPHIMLGLEVTEDDGSTTYWDVETAPVISWERHNLDRNFVAVGETVTLIGWVAQSGANEMGLSAIVNKDQQTMVVRENRAGGGTSGRSPARSGRTNETAD